MAELSDKARAFLQERRFAVLGTINPDSTPQLSAMWYELDGDEIVMNTKVGRVKERNLRRDPRMSLCIEDGARYVTLEGRAELIEDRAQQEREVNDLIAPRYIGQRLGGRRWEVIKDSDRLGIRMRIERVHARGV